MVPWVNAELLHRIEECIEAIGESREVTLPEVGLEHLKALVGSPGLGFITH